MSESGCVRSREHEIGVGPALTGEFPRQMLRRQLLLRPAPADGGHCLHREVIRHVQRVFRAGVIEPGHPVHDQPLDPPLQGKAHPGGAGVVGMRDERAARLLVRRARDEHEERGGAMAPGPVAFVQQLEEQRPVLRVAARIEEPPRLRIAG